MTGVLIERVNEGSGHRHTGRMPREETRGGAAIHEPRSQAGTKFSLTALRKNQPGRHLDLGLLPPGL